jgi:hypothetical protein
LSTRVLEIRSKPTRNRFGAARISDANKLRQENLVFLMIPVAKDSSELLVV